MIKNRKMLSGFMSVMMLTMMLIGIPVNENVAQASSPYEVSVAVPACDSGNSQVQFISSNTDWDLINDPSKSIFCVQPGDYTSKGTINLTASGTSSAKRYIRYYNPSNPSDNTHPVLMSSGDRAIIKQLVFQGADYVVIDRLNVKEPNQIRVNVVRFHNSYASTDNVLNRMLIEGGGDGGGQVSFYGGGGSDRNTLQLSVVRNTIVSPGDDNHCVLLSDDAEDTRVISNEIYNCAGDVIQLHPGVYNGTIIANNDIYNDPSFVQYTENGIDIKGGGSSTTGDLVTIEGNRLFSLGGAGGSGGSIGAIDFSNDIGVKSYILFKDNIFFDNPLPWTTNTGGGVGSAHHLSIVGNVIYNAGAAAIEPIKNTNSIEVYYNTIVNVASAGKWLHGLPTSQDVMCNVIISGQDVDTPASGTTGDYNAYYNTAGQLQSPGTHDVIGSTAAASNNTGLTFQYKLLTGAQNYTIPTAVISSSSPHQNLCAGASVGSRTGMGVDDNTYAQTDAGATLTSSGGSSDSVAPTVSMTAPTGGSTVSGTLAVSANASDNIGVVGVQFKVDGTNIGSEDTGAPFTVNWNTTGVSNGTHSLTAVARDAAGNTTTSTAVSVTVSNASDIVAPTVSLTAPTGGSTVSGTAAVSANASDNVGVVGVQFKVDGTNIGSEDTGAPFTVNWNTTGVSNGTHSLTAVARDAAGNTTTSSTVSVTVSNSSDTVAPTVSLTAPTGGSTVSGTTAVSANASDNVAVVGVQFKLDGVNLGSEDTNSPFSINWSTTSASNGAHSLTAVARDAAGNTTTSSAVSVTVSNSSTLISETFQTGSDASHLTPVSGTWGIADARYTLNTPVTGTAPNNNISLHNTSVTGDFTMLADGKAKNNSGSTDNFSMIFNYQDVNNYYFVNFSESNTSTTHGLFKVAAGTATQLADFSASLISGDGVYPIKIVKSGSSISVYFGTTLIATGIDSSFVDGKIGFGGNKIVQFDNLTVSN